MKHLIEIQAGEGGEDSKLFVDDLFSAYRKYINKLQCALEVVYQQSGKIGFIVTNAPCL